MAGKFYSVYKGKSGEPKIFTSWDECKKEVIGFKGAIYKSFKTKEEAEKFQSTIMYQRSNPIFIEINGIPLGEMMRSILQLKLDSNQISSTQYGRVLRTIEQIEKYPIGKKRIDEITSTEIQVYLNAQKHLSNSTLLKLFGQFNQTFKVAMNRGYIMKNPMIDVLKPKSEKETKNVRALTVEEQQEFTAYLMSKNVNIKMSFSFKCIVV